MCYANIHCEEPLAALPGHHFILRGFTTIAGRGTTSGGGKIVAILPPRHRRREMDRWQAELRSLDQGDLGERLLVLLRQAGLTGAGVDELKMRAASGLKSINRELDKLMAERKALKYDREQNRYVESSVLEELISKTEGVVSDFHKANPLLPGIPAEQLRSTLSHNLDSRIFRLLADELDRRGIAIQEGDIIRITSHRVRLDADETKLTREVRSLYSRAGLAPPRPEEVAQDLGRPEAEVMELVRHLARTGHLTHVSKDMYVSTDAVDDLRTRLISHLSQHGEITTQSFKSLVGATRKHVIPLAEFFDREKTTLRVGDKRVLRRKSSEGDGG
jgi:selenocysteine-specific elongation factor